MSNGNNNDYSKGFIIGALVSEEFREKGEMDPGIEFLLKNKHISPK